MKLPTLKQFLATALLLQVLSLSAQNKTESAVEFKNAPVLFKQNHASFQQVIVSCKADQPGTFLVREAGKEVLKADLKKGKNSHITHISTRQDTSLPS